MADGRGDAVTTSAVSPAIEVRDLVRDYGTRRALDGVSFDVALGEVFGLLGPNGGGKTTLFRILATLLPAGAGHARILNHDVTRSPDAVRREIGVTFQSPSVDPKLTVIENLKYHGQLYGLSRQVIDERVPALAERLGITERLGDIVETLSGGQQRRVEIAKSLLHRPRVLLLDEPSTGLDPGIRHELWRVLRGLVAEQSLTVLVTTHLMDEAERCDRLAILDRGRLVALGAPDLLRSEVGGDCVTIDCAAPGALAESLRQAFQIPVREVEGRLRIERPDGHELVRDIMARFSEQVRSIQLGRPTLEDVFIHKTGRPFEHEAPPPARPKRRH